MRGRARRTRLADGGASDPSDISPHSLRHPIAYQIIQVTGGRLTTVHDEARAIDEQLVDPLMLGKMRAELAETMTVLRILEESDEWLGPAPSEHTTPRFRCIPPEGDSRRVFSTSDPGVGPGENRGERPRLEIRILVLMFGLTTPRRALTHPAAVARSSRNIFILSLLEAVVRCEPIEVQNSLRSQLSGYGGRR